MMVDLDLAQLKQLTNKCLWNTVSMRYIVRVGMIVDTNDPKKSASRDTLEWPRSLQRSASCSAFDHISPVGAYSANVDKPVAQPNCKH